MASKKKGKKDAAAPAPLPEGSGISVHEHDVVLRGVILENNASEVVFRYLFSAGPGEEPAEAVSKLDKAEVLELYQGDAEAAEPDYVVIPRAYALAKGFIKAEQEGEAGQQAPLEEPEAASGVEYSAGLDEFVPLFGRIVEQKDDGIVFCVDPTPGEENGPGEFHILYEHINVINKGAEGKPDHIEVSLAFAQAAGLAYAAVQAEDAAPLPDQHFVRQENITVTQPLSDAEKLEYGDEMAAAMKRIEELKEEQKAKNNYYKGLIAEQETTGANAAKLWREGKEERTVFCNLIADYAAGEMVWSDAETGDVIERRKMTAEESQYPLLKKTPPSPQHSLFDGPAEPADTVDAAAPEPEPEDSVTLNGRLISNTSSSIIFLVDYGDAEIEYEIPLGMVISKSFDAEDCGSIAVPTGYAIGAGIIEAPAQDDADEAAPDTPAEETTMPEPEKAPALEAAEA